MKIKCLCEKCGTTHEWDSENKIYTCEKCGAQYPTEIASRNYQTTEGKILASANQSYDEAFSYSNAYVYFKTYIENEPDSLDGFLGMLSSRIRMSTILEPHFKEVAELFNQKEMNLDEGTYIRIGHFIEMSYVSCFIFINKTGTIYKQSTNLIEKAAICKCFWEIRTLLDSLKNSLDIFTDDEKKESFFLDDSEIVSFSSSVNSLLANDGNVEVVDEKCYLYINNQKIDCDSTNKETFKDVQDKTIFIEKPNNKFVIVIFCILGVSALAIVAGLILMLANFAVAGGACLGTGAVVFAVTYIIHKKIHDKFINQINNY